MYTLTPPLVFSISEERESLEAEVALITDVFSDLVYGAGQEVDGLNG